MPRQIIVAETVAGPILWSDKPMTELQHSDAELRAAVMLAGKEIRELNFEFWPSRQPSACLPFFAASCGSLVQSRAKRESPCGSDWT